MLRRYIFCAGPVEIGAGAAALRRELWIGFSVDSDRPLDLERFSRAHGYNLIPADGLSVEELASVGVVNFPRVDLGTCDRELES